MPARKGQKKKGHKKKGGKRMVKFTRTDGRLLKDLVRGEENYSFGIIDFANINTMIGVNSTIRMTALNGYLFATCTGVPAGGGQGQRSGPWIQPRHLSLKYDIVMPNTASFTQNQQLYIRVRTLVVWIRTMYGDAANSGASLMPEIQEFLEMPPTNPMTTGQFGAFLNKQDRKRYRVLEDKTHILSVPFLVLAAGAPTVAGPAGGPCNIHHQSHHNLLSLPRTTYNSNNSTTVDHNEGLICVLCWTDNLASNVAPPQIQVSYILDYFG